MTYKSIFSTLIFLFASTKAMADFDDEEKIDPQFSFYMILAGAGILFIGKLISSIKQAEKFGNGVSLLGMGIGGFGALGIALLLFDWAYKQAIRLVIAVAVVVGVGYIFYKIYEWITGKNDSD